MSSWLRVVRDTIDGGFKRISGLVREGLNLEFRTDAGKINFRGMLLALLLVALLVVSRILPDLVESLRGQSGKPVVSGTEMVIAFGLWTLLCSLMLLYGDRNLRDPDRSGDDE